MHNKESRQCNAMPSYWIRQALRAHAVPPKYIEREKNERLGKDMYQVLLYAQYCGNSMYVSYVRTSYSV